MPIEQEPTRMRLAPEELAELRELVEGNLDNLVLYARTRCSAPEDAVQDALTDLVRQPQLPGDTVAWLYQAVRWRASNQRRHESRDNQHLRLLAEQVPAWFDNQPTNDIDVAELQAAIASLPELEREIVVLKIWANRTFSEIATHLEVSTSQIHRLYWSAVERLKAMLVPPTEEPSATRGFRAKGARR